MNLFLTFKLKPEQHDFWDSGKRRAKYGTDFHRKHLSFRILFVLFIMTFDVTKMFAQNLTVTDTAFSETSVSGTDRRLLGGTITNFGNGGPVIKFSQFKNQFAFMTGGRGSCTINNRYTLGGGGYGIASSVILTDTGTDTDTSHYYKMGYGGLELGYICYSGRKINIGSAILVAAGAELLESKPETNSGKSSAKDFNILPVIEPSFYVELMLKDNMRLHTGISYRFVKSSDLDNISVPDMSGFSCYIGLLFGKW